MKRMTKADRTARAKNLLLTAIVAACAVGLGASQAMAATWTGGGNGTDWSDPTNWQGNTVPGDTNGISSTTTDSASFTGTGMAHPTITIDSGRAIYALSFGAEGYTIGSQGSNAGNALAFIGTNSRVTGDSAIIDAPLVLTNSWFVQPNAGKTIAFNGDITTPASPAYTVVEMLNSSGTVEFNGSWSGNGRFHVNGGSTAGLLVINNTNTNAGGVETDVTLASVELAHAGAVTNAQVYAQRGGNFIVSAANAITGSSHVILQDYAGGTTHYASALDIQKSNDYTGSTTLGTFGTTTAISTGAELWANNATGSATGSGDVTVKHGVLGGSGFIDNESTSNGVTIQAGGKLSPGASAGAIGTLTLTTGSKGFDISGAVSAASSQSLIFDLDTPGTSDQLVLDGTLKIGSGTLDFSDFAFNPTVNLATGVYTLFDTNANINGTLALTNLSGAIGTNGATGTLSILNDQDIVLTVAVPEPASGALALLALGGVLLLPRQRNGTRC